MDIPSTPPHRRQLTRDERIQAQILHQAGHTYIQIAKQLDITVYHVQYACTHQATPQNHARGRHLLLHTPDRKVLTDWVTTSKATRRTPYYKIPAILGWEISSKAIQNALEKEGFHRRLGRRKPPISVKNRALRLAWAHEHLNWTRSQWDYILWTDETWIKDGKHTRTWVTRQTGEEFDPTCIIERLVKRKGWMFWGSFSGGLGLGPCQFWEKDWGSINKETYAAHLIPLIDGWIRLHPELDLMQDGAPGHAAKETLKDLSERGIRLIIWPPFSPDLNPIETLWNDMKNWIGAHYAENLTYTILRQAVRASWDAIGQEKLDKLLDTMQARCQAVIDADGMHTKY